MYSPRMNPGALRRFPGKFPIFNLGEFVILESKKLTTFRNKGDKIVQGRRLKKDDQIPGTIPFVMAGTTNSGVVNYISNPVARFPKNSITVDIFGNVFYRDFEFGAGDDTGVYWNDNEGKEYSKEAMLFFAIVIAKSLSGKFSFGNKIMKPLTSAVQKLLVKDLIFQIFGEETIENI